MATDFSSKEALLQRKHQLEQQLLGLRKNKSQSLFAYPPGTRIAAGLLSQQKHEIEAAELGIRQTQEMIDLINAGIEQWEKTNASSNQEPILPPPDESRKGVVLPLLEENGWSILDWARKAGVAYNSANSYLNGRKTYRSTRHKLAKAFGLIKLPN